MLPWEASLKMKKRVTFLTGSPAAPSVLPRWAEIQPLFPRKGNYFWFSVPAEKRHTKRCLIFSQGQQGTGKRPWGALTCTSWHGDEGKSTAAGNGWTWDVPATPEPGAVEAEETVFEAIHCLRRTGKGVPGRKHWSSFLLLCPAQTWPLTSLKEGV